MHFGRNDGRPGRRVCGLLPKERNEAFMRHSRYAEGTAMVFGVPRGRALPQLRTGKGVGGIRADGVCL